MFNGRYKIKMELGSTEKDNNLKSLGLVKDNDVTLTCLLLALVS
jgi:hypothetical protein